MNKSIRVSWDDVVSKTKEWHKSYVQFSTTDEVNSPVSDYNPILLEKEWEAIKAIKQWKQDPQSTISLQDFNESERQSFEKLNSKSKVIAYVKNDEKPYKKMFFIPITIWNDDPDAYPAFVPLQSGTILSSYSEMLLQALTQRALNSMHHYFNGVKFGHTYSFQMGNLWFKRNIDSLLNEGIDFKDIDLTNITSSFNKEVSAFTPEIQKRWLISALIPITVSTQEFSDILDFDFNHDDMFSEQMAQFKDIRQDFEEPTDLENALESLERIDFSLWANTILYSDPADNIVKRETEINFHTEGSTVVYMSVCIMDIDDNDEIVTSLSNGRKIFNVYDIQQALLSWVMCVDNRCAWTVYYTENKPEQKDIVSDEHPISYNGKTLH